MVRRSRPRYDRPDVQARVDFRPRRRHDDKERPVMGKGNKTRKKEVKKPKQDKKDKKAK